MAQKYHIFKKETNNNWHWKCIYVDDRQEYEVKTNPESSQYKRNWFTEFYSGLHRSNPYDQN